MKTTLYLTRHGETESSLADIYYGRSLSPITDNGRLQIELLVKRLSSVRINAVYSSPLDRCFEAATLIAESHGLFAVPIDDLIEIDHGKWDGLTRKEIEKYYPDSYQIWQKDPAGNSPEEGESGYSVAARAIPAIYRLVSYHPGKNIIVIAHNAINRILMCHFLGLPIMEYRRRIFQYPASLNCIQFFPNGVFHVTLVNDISHLKEMNSIESDLKHERLILEQRDDDTI